MEKSTLPDLVRFLDELEMNPFVVPKNIRIPDWPFIAVWTRVDLGQRDFFYPIASFESGLYRLVHTKGRKRDLSFSIDKDGSFRVYFTGADMLRHSGNSKGENEFDRMLAVILFHQFKEEIFERIGMK